MQQDAVAGGENAVCIDDWRHAFQRTDEVISSLNLLLDAGNNLVILPHLAIAVVEVAPQIGCLLTGIRHVEGVLC